MKREVLFGILIMFLVLNVSFAIAEVNETKVDKAYECLEGKIGDCSLLSIEEKIFSLLAVKECKDEVIEDSTYKSDTKLTAQAILALDKVNVNTDEAEEWLLSQNTTPLDMDWLLQIESTEETTCAITYEGSSFPNIVIRADKTISSDAGACLTRYGGDYWLKISQACYDYEFKISCDKSFSTNLLYKKTTGSGSDIIYVSEDTHTASTGGTTTEKVNSFCFAQGTSCDYEASLWAALVLDFKEYDISSYIPYLVTMADEIENAKYLPESFLYSLTNNFYNDLLVKQYNDGYWLVSGDKYYDTALALFPFQNEKLTEKTNAINWLLEGGVQDKDGCWQGNIRNTAFILYSVWPKGILVNGEEGIDCDDAGYDCMSRMSCIDAGGDVLEDYTGCFGTNICCSKEKILETCSELGGEVCGSGEECSISTIEALDTSECCLGSCKTLNEKSECELDVDGECRTSCYSDEKIEDYECPSGKVCCVKKTISEKGNYWWIWALLGLIVLVVVGIIFKDKLRTSWFKIKSKFGKSKPGPRPGLRPAPPGRPLRRVMPRRILSPAQQRRPVKKPVARKPRKEMEDVFKKLREMGK